MTDNAFSDVYLRKQIARASALLPAGGAWDASPLVLQCAGLKYVTLYFTYTRGGAGGAFNFCIDISPDGSGTNWYQMTQYAPAVLVAGTDSVSNFQRESVTYTAISGNPELVVYGVIELYGTVDRIRIPAREIGNIAAPGTLACIAVFS